MAVAVVPGAFVTVITTGRNQPVQHFRQILLKPGLELNGADGAGAANVENVNDSVLHLRFAHNARNLVREIVHFFVPGSLNLDFVLKGHANFYLILPLDAKFESDS